MENMGGGGPLCIYIMEDMGVGGRGSTLLIFS